MSRRDYYDDPNAPRANSLVPAASAVIVDHDGSVLLIRRTDNGLWSIPGGAMEPGESIADCCIREVKEETGLDITLGRVVGIYTNPGHVVAYDDGEIRQEFSICFGGTVVGGGLTTSSESEEVAFVPIAALSTFDIHPSIRQRIKDYLELRSEPVVR